LAACVDVDGVDATTFEFKGVGASAAGGTFVLALVPSTTEEDGGGGPAACCLGAGVDRILPLLKLSMLLLFVLLFFGAELELGNESDMFFRKRKEKSIIH
jgi:hypothetical protein